MKDSTDVSIVVLNYNTSGLLNSVLESIVSTIDHISYDVTVIDNASTDGGLARVKDRFKKDSHFLFMQMKNNIGWVAINPVLERTRGKYIVTIDPDAVLHHSALEAMFLFMEANPIAGAVTAKLFNTDGSPQLYYRRIMTPVFYFSTTVLGRIIDKYFLGLHYWKLYRYENLDLNQISEVEQPAWPCLMWRREALGTYIVDERLPFYFLDVEMSRRLYNRGYKIFLVPDAIVTHLKSMSFGKRNNTWRWKEYYRGLIIYFWSYYPHYTPFIWFFSKIDRLSRYLIMKIIGREPLR